MTRAEEPEWEGGPQPKPRATSPQCKDSTPIPPTPTPTSWPEGFQTVQEESRRKSGGPRAPGASFELCK